MGSSSPMTCDLIATCNSFSQDISLWLANYCPLLTPNTSSNEPPNVKVHHQSFLHHGTHKASTVSLLQEQSCATFRISLQVRCMDLSSFSADLRQVILGLPRSLFPSGVQNKLSLATSPESFLNTCPIHVHFLRVMSTMMSSCLQMFRTSRLDTFCGHLMPSS